MDFMHVLTHFLLSLYLLFTHINKCNALPITDLDTFISTPVDIDFPNYRFRPVVQNSSLLDRLTRGYYYIDNGKITPVERTYSNQNVPRGRRLENIPDLDRSNEENQNGARYTQLAQYNKNHAKRKMLFVPNLFG